MFIYSKTPGLWNPDLVFTNRNMSELAHMNLFLALNNKLIFTGYNLAVITGRNELIDIAEI